MKKHYEPSLVSYEVKKNCTWILRPANEYDKFYEKHFFIDMVPEL